MSRPFAPSRRPIGRPAGTAAAILMVVLCLLSALGGVPASRADTVTSTSTPTPIAPTTSAAPTAARGTGRAPLMVILDASGSMKQQDARGTRMDQARGRLSSVLSDLPDDATVGMLVYGTGTGPNTSEQTAGCRDVHSLAPIAPIDEDALNDAADAVVPSGYSPIGAAIAQAAAALPTDSPATILLISDGFDLCSDPDPCTSAKDAMTANPELTVNVIGIQPDAAANTLFGCITSSTGGTYLPLHYDDATSTSTAGSAEQSASSAATTVAQERLGQALAAGYQRGVQGFSPTGTSVAGTPTADGAPTLTPGDYLDESFTRGSFNDGGTQKIGTVRYYRLAQGDRMTPWAAATVVGDVRSDNYQQLGVRLSLVNDSDDPCLPQVEETDDGGATGPRPMVTAQVGGVRPGTSIWNKSCPTDEPTYLRVERLGKYRFGTSTPIQLVVRSEPMILGKLGTAASTAATDPAPVTASGPGAAVAGGTNFATAPVLAAGTTISDTIVSGETRFFAVPLGWGQRLSYQVLPTGAGTPVGQATDGSIQIRNPLGTPVRILADGQGFPFEGRDDSTGLTGSTDVPVGAENRSSDDPQIARYAMSGTYYLLLSTAPSARDQVDATIPYRLTVSVAGSAGTAVTPSYASAVPATESASLSPTTSGGAPTVPLQQAATAPVIRVPTWLWVLGGAGVLLIALAAALLLRRRRSSGRYPPPVGS